MTVQYDGNPPAAMTDMSDDALIAGLRHWAEQRSDRHGASVLLTAADRIDEARQALSAAQERERQTEELYNRRGVALEKLIMKLSTVPGDWLTILNDALHEARQALRPDGGESEEGKG